MSTDQTERVGVEAVRFKLASLGWFPKEAARPDYGVDLFVELAGEDGRPNGRLLAVQVKSGPSYISATGGSTLYVDHAHVEYWNGFSLPVIVVLYNPRDDVAYWQSASLHTLEPTGTAWKLLVPHEQILDADALLPLGAIAADVSKPDLAEGALSHLRTDLTWMQILDRGGSVVLEADEWINKTSGRGDLRLIAHSGDVRGKIERKFVVFLGPAPFSEALPDLFPWANLHTDEDALDSHDEDEWMEETGIWDSEDKCYIGNSEGFSEWRASRYPDEELRPIGESAGEVAHWRVPFELNDLGRAVLVLEQYLSTT